MNILDMLRAAWTQGYVTACGTHDLYNTDWEEEERDRDVQRILATSHDVQCPDCHGVGEHADELTGDTIVTCARCNGTGSLDARSLDVTVVEDPDPTALSTALNTLEAAALSGTQLHGDDVHRLRATVDRLTGGRSG